MFTLPVCLRAGTKEITGIDFRQGQTEIFQVKIFCIRLQTRPSGRSPIIDLAHTGENYYVKAVASGVGPKLQ